MMAKWLELQPGCNCEKNRVIYCSAIEVGTGRGPDQVLPLAQIIILAFLPTCSKGKNNSKCLF